MVGSGRNIDSAERSVRDIGDIGPVYLLATTSTARIYATEKFAGSGIIENRLTFSATVTEVTLEERSNVESLGKKIGRGGSR